MPSDRTAYGHGPTGRRGQTGGARNGCGPSRPSVVRPPAIRDAPVLARMGACNGNQCWPGQDDDDGRRLGDVREVDGRQGAERRQRRPCRKRRERRCRLQRGNRGRGRRPRRPGKYQRSRRRKLRDRRSRGDWRRPRRRRRAAERRRGECEDVHWRVQRRGEDDGGQEGRGCRCGDGAGRTLPARMALRRDASEADRAAGTRRRDRTPLVAGDEVQVATVGDPPDAADDRRRVDVLLPATVLDIRHNAVSRPNSSPGSRRSASRCRRG